VERLNVDPQSRLVFSGLFLVVANWVCSVLSGRWRMVILLVLPVPPLFLFLFTCPYVQHLALEVLKLPFYRLHDDSNSQFAIVNPSHYCYCYRCRYRTPYNRPFHPPLHTSTGYRLFLRHVHNHSWNYGCELDFEHPLILRQTSNNKILC
jgi:hypothetical protein